MIYWADETPENAQFALHPFLPGPPISFDQVIHTLPSEITGIHAVKQSFLPDFQGWKERIELAIGNGELKKVVLARETTLQLASIPDPFGIAAALKNRSKGATVFCASLPDGSYLLGATPERLFKKQGDQIQVEALAGTRPIGKGQELLHSEKDRREFQYVQDHFDERLKPYLASSLSFSAPFLHQTATLHHLKSIGTARLKPGVSEKELIAALHPSPALLGTPSKAALCFLQDHEPFARGFYGGLIGWSSGFACDWRVVIRCCLIRGSLARLYTGTGIVQGSDSEEEWAELETKQSLYRDIFSCSS